MRWYFIDFKRCFSGKVAIDGGLEYKNRIGSSLFIHEITSIDILQILDSFWYNERVSIFYLDGIPVELHDFVCSISEKAKLDRQ